jgi:integrase
MSVYKTKRSPYFAYDFWIDGRRFVGSTRCKNRLEAKAVEKEERARARAECDRALAEGRGPMTISAAADRYFEEVGQHHAGAATTARDLVRLSDYFGAGRRLEEIGDDEVAQLVAWRRGQTVKGRRTTADPADPKRRRPAPLVSPSTVNRSTIEPLQKLFNRAILVWGVKLPRPPLWKRHILPEVEERVREVRAAEEAAFQAIRADYRPVVDFARASGLRLAECLMKKECVDLAGGYVRVIGKGGKRIVKPMTAEMRAILMSAMANPTDHVFTYAAARPNKGKNGWPRGAPRPITASGLKTMWRRSRRRKKGPSLPPDLRFHDLRHDFATKLLRETGNLKLVQRALDHAEIETTTRYAHVLDEEVLAGMEAASKRRKAR